jgi:hypothetical protein
MLRAFKVFFQLGPRQTFWYAVYQAGLRAGIWRRQTPPVQPTRAGRLLPLLPLLERSALTSVLDITTRVRLMNEAEEICAGQVRLFGGAPAALGLVPSGKLVHWSDYERKRASFGVEDVKLIWEPARFGWAFALARAYLLAGEERFAAAFWRNFETFERANPPNLGPNWTSGQEVALRLLALLFASGAFAGSAESTPERTTRLAQSVLAHARRIPPTLSYARAQHNNHLISEALGLYAAGLCLPDQPEAPAWRVQGWQELNRALQEQIQPDGTYAQHSTSYHRLMLQAALLAGALARRDPSAGADGLAWPAETRPLLAAAARWLEERSDPLSGRASNLGSNDGANILPLAPGEIYDYRPTIQAAAQAFTGKPVLPPGPWDELGLWLGLPPAPDPNPTSGERKWESRLDKADKGGWASLRAVRFSSRPSHADQLHVEIWSRGEALALDAGTYHYNARPPWNNGLASARAHNTVTVDGQDPMTRAGLFLWLDWDQARLLSRETRKLSAEHSGYRKLGLIHRRTLEETLTGWKISDYLIPASASAANAGLHTFKLHWLLPDWPYQREGRDLIFTRPSDKALSFKLVLEAEGEEDRGPLLQMVRAGESILGPDAHAPLLGWVSPTYALRQPAISVLFSVTARAPLTFLSEFIISR